MCSTMGYRPYYSLYHSYQNVTGSPYGSTDIQDHFKNFHDPGVARAAFHWGGQTLDTHLRT